ncbi:hypothetical protein ACFWY5_52545 [Nonomuraea sp. NPDC059007]|uniref:hypothetical protein n=1 Tax=Nonomuraea sp. NPDC059007 TaxID=3346692 RepID=UPI0036867EA7
MRTRTQRDTNLAQTLKEQLAGWSHRSGIQVETWALPAEEVPDRVAEAVLACVAEALAGIEERASAAMVSVAVTTGTNGLLFTVSDDGMGSDAKNAGMRAALVATSGTISINGTPDGCTVRGAIPRERWQ